MHKFPVETFQEVFLPKVLEGDAKKIQQSAMSEEVNLRTYVDHLINEVRLSINYWDNALRDRALLYMPRRVGKTKFLVDHYKKVPSDQSSVILVEKMAMKNLILQWHDKFASVYTMYDLKPIQGKQPSHIFIDECEDADPEIIFNMFPQSKILWMFTDRPGELRTAVSKYFRKAIVNSKDTLCVEIPDNHVEGLKYSSPAELHPGVW